MSGEPTSGGPTFDPFPKLSAPLGFSRQSRLMLRTLIEHHANTRFGNHALKNVPMRESKVSLLLSVCGYHVRRGDQLESCGASGRWLDVPSPTPAEPMLDFLRHACERDWPSLSMDPNDERLEVVFSV